MRPRAEAPARTSSKLPPKRQWAGTPEPSHGTSRGAPVAPTRQVALTGRRVANVPSSERVRRQNRDVPCVDGLHLGGRLFQTPQSDEGEHANGNHCLGTGARFVPRRGALFPGTSNWRPWVFAGEGVADDPRGPLLGRRLGFVGRDGSACARARPTRPARLVGGATRDAEEASSKEGRGGGRDRSWRWILALGRVLPGAPL
jgi:hypothetical protein